MQGARQNK